WKESTDPRDAGGILFDLGSHLIDQAVTLFGRPARVYAEIDTRRRGAATPDDVFLALTHSGGVRSHLWMSATAAQLGPRL
ncbi:oxidoreductase, partial [Micromonospora aurantiaca]|nr:oxidoreductase [Micromonospora aurantiaca]